MAGFRSLLTPELCIKPILSQEIIMRALFDHAAVVDHQIRSIMASAESR